MRTATGIISIIIGLIISIQSFILFMGGAVFSDKDANSGGALGLFVALLLFIGGAFAFKLPKISLVFTLLASLFAFMTGSTTDFKDMTVWGIIALILTIMNLFAARRPKPPSPTAQ